ncbi:MAG: hypothetical protein J5737_01745 [Bacteroidales bacterium]|nr:hypothetical protein [Bacteroidales bacterium]
MKKIQFLSAAVLCILAAASCEKEIAAPEDIRTVISVSMPDSKTALGELEGNAWHNYWKAGDCISVNGVASEALGSQAEGQSTAEFVLNGVITTPYYAAYPASAVSGYGSGSASLAIPAQQKYVQGSYDPEAFVMIGQSAKEGSVALSPAVSVFHLSVTGNGFVSKVKLTGAADAALSGSFTTDFSACSPASVSNTVEMTPESPVALPADFFICVPAGLSGSVQVELSDPNGGSKSAKATIKTPLAAGVVYSPAALSYNVSSDLQITAEGITSSTAVICVASVPSDAYTFNVYSDQDCTSLVDSFAVPAGSSCWSDKSPRFCISGLESGTTYYVRVSDDTAFKQSNVLPVTTTQFIIVEPGQAPASVGDVILAEDFSELRWDCDMIGAGAGWFPASQDSFANTEVSSFRAVATSGELQLSSQASALAGSRLAHWAQGANPNLYIHPGYLKLVGSNKVTHIVTPALDNIPAGMFATLEVELTASAYYSESSGTFCTKNAIVAVQAPGDLNELTGESKTNTLDLETKVAPITLIEETAWNTYKVTLSGVAKGSRLAFGAAKDVTKNDARMNLSDIKVTIKDIEEDATNINIKDDATFQKFVNAVAGGNKAVNATLALSGTTLNLSSSTVNSFESIEDFEGTFDGNGKTISGLTKPMFATLMGTVKDLTLNSTIKATDAEDTNWGMFAKVLLSGDAVASLHNCEAQGSVTYTPASALEKDCQIGGLVGNNKGGSISGCTNKASVSLGSNGQTNSSQASVGGVVGRTQKGGSTQGSISDCSNSGSVSCAAALSENLYLGGVVGYQVEKKELISGCENGGLVEAGSSFSTTKALHIGGVIGLGKGMIESCHNLSSGVVTTAYGSSAGTYLCQGGVVGRLNRDAADITYTGLTNYGIVNVDAFGGEGSDSSVGRLIGGVVGRCNEGAAIEDLTNNGSINYSSTEALPTYIGGVVASNTTAELSLENCRSIGGVISYTGKTAKGPLYIGGVVGYSTRPVSGCINAMTLEIGGEFEATSNQYYCVGGVVGKGSGNQPISNCLNTGDITYSQQISGSNGYTFLGGVVGHTAGSIVDCSNGGTVTVTGCNNAQDPFFGGVVGSTDSKNEHSITGMYPSASATNYGSVVINTDKQSKKYVRVGGVAGRLHTNGSMSVTNSGPVTVTSLTCTQLHIGGLTGYANGPVESGSDNSGTITVGGLTTSQDAYIGGFVGALNNGSIAGATNSGDVVIASDANITRYLCAGGIAGTIGGQTVSACYNAGAVSNAGTAGTFAYIGGCIGRITGSAVLTGTASSYNYNAGAVSETSETSNLAIGGVVGANQGADMDMAYARNSGEINYSGNVRYESYVGGVLGMGDAICTMDYASNEGNLVFRDLTISHQIWVGGVLGAFNAYNSDVKGAEVTLTGLTNSGNIDCPQGEKYTLGSDGKTKYYGYHMAIDMDKKPTAFSYVGGISGVGDCGTKKFIDCHNSGDITFQNQLRVRLGGIAGYLTNNPTGCSVDDATIIYYRYNPAGLSDSNGVVGGIVGYMDVETVHDLTFIGRLQTTGSSPNSYTGGLIGQIGSKCSAFNDCKIYAPVNIVGASSGSFASTGAGLFASRSTKVTVSPYDFTGCKVKKGTKVQKIEITDENMAEAVIGRNHASSVTNPPVLVDEF